MTGKGARWGGIVALLLGATSALASPVAVDRVLDSLPLPPSPEPVTEDALFPVVPGSLPGGRSAFLPMIRRAAEQHGVPPAIVDAVVRIESAYSPTALGGVGEIGLMQVRPTTAAMLGFRGTTAELADPETNISYGVTYLAQAWRLSGGDLCRALMKYRAGHGEERMTPLSVEYCRRARVHLVSIGASVDPLIRVESANLVHTGKSSRVIGATAAQIQRATRAGAPASLVSHATVRAISLRSKDQFFAAHRANIEEARARLSVMHKLKTDWTAQTFRKNVVSKKSPNSSPPVVLDEKHRRMMKPGGASAGG